MAKLDAPFILQRSPWWPGRKVLSVHVNLRPAPT